MIIQSEHRGSVAMLINIDNEDGVIRFGTDGTVTILKLENLVKVANM